MDILNFRTGIYDVNTYLLADKESKEGIIIDLGGDSDELLENIKNKDIKIKCILNTHGHFDHISGEIYFQQKYETPAFININDMYFVENLETILEYMNEKPHKPPKITGYLDENSELFLGKTPIKVITTPGHTKGGVCFLIENNLFSGDTLFFESVGRTDLPGGSFEEIKHSIKNKLFLLNENITVYPGHGKITNIKHEKLHNNFVR